MTHSSTDLPLRRSQKNDGSWKSLGKTIPARGDQYTGAPYFSFWESLIGPGTLCVVTVSGYEQGLAAGKIARSSLVEGRNPASLVMEPTIKGELMISLARARWLGIAVNTTMLLTARVAEKIDWEVEDLSGVP
jgi:hypothetical protein